MKACFSSIATSFANPQNDMCDEIIDLTDREAQAYKKRRTGIMSYAEASQKTTATNNPTAPPAPAATGTLTVEKIQAVIASEIAKQLATTNTNIDAKFDMIEQTVEKLNEKLDENAEELEAQIHLFASETEEKMFKNFEKITTAFAAQGEVMNVNLNEHINNQMAVMATQNAINLKTLEEKTAKAFSELQMQLFPPHTRNRPVVNTTVHNNTPHPAVTPGSAATDTQMSVDGQDE